MMDRLPLSDVSALLGQRSKLRSLSNFGGREEPSEAIYISMPFSPRIAEGQ